MQNKRVDYIDAIKGFAAICVIIGHVCDGYLGSGLFGADNVLLVTIFKIVYAFHMALFFIISGFLFDRAYVGDDGTIKKEKLKPQLFNVAFVYVLFSIFLWAFKIFFSQSINKPVAVKDILFIWCKTIGPYWYLYVLLVIYLLMMLLKKLKVNTYILLVVGLGCNIASNFLGGIGDLFEIQRILYYFIFFLLGCIWNEKQNLFVKKRKIFYIIGGVSIAVMAVSWSFTQ